MERDRFKIWKTVQTKHFNSHAHVERDAWGYRPNGIAGISTHTLTWSVTIHTKTIQPYRKFQLTRSRGA